MLFWLHVHAFSNFSLLCRFFQNTCGFISDRSRSNRSRNSGCAVYPITSLCFFFELFIAKWEKNCEKVYLPFSSVFFSWGVGGGKRGLLPKHFNGFLARRRRKNVLGILENTLNLMAPQALTIPPRFCLPPPGKKKRYLSQDYFYVYQLFCFLLLCLRHGGSYSGSETPSIPETETTYGQHDKIVPPRGSLAAHVSYSYDYRGRPRKRNLKTFLHIYLSANIFLRFWIMKMFFFEVSFCSPLGDFFPIREFFLKKVFSDFLVLKNYKIILVTF